MNIDVENVKKLREDMTDGPWRDGKTGDSIVSDSPVHSIGGADAIEYYGGYCVAESVNGPNRRAIIKLPDIMDLCLEQAETIESLTEVCPGCGGSGVVQMPECNPEGCDTCEGTGRAPILTGLLQESNANEYVFSERIKELESTLSEKDAEIKRLQEIDVENERLRDRLEALVNRNADIEARYEQLRYLASEVVGERGLNGSVERMETFLEGDCRIDSYSRYKAALNEIANGLTPDAWAAVKAREALDGMA